MKSNWFIPHFVPYFFKIKGGPEKPPWRALNLMRSSPPFLRILLRHPAVLHSGDRIPAVTT